MEGVWNKKVKIRFPEQPGKYTVYFDILAGGYDLAQNSKGYVINVK